MRIGLLSRLVEPQSTKLPSMPQISARHPASVLLDDLLLRASGERVALGWLMAGLEDRSFGLLMLVLATVSLVPGASNLTGILLVLSTLQMLLGYTRPAIPPRLARSRIGTRRLAWAVGRTAAALRRVEGLARPRWPIPPAGAAQRIIGAVGLPLGMLLLVPIPLSNIPPALVLALLAVAQLEEDGYLLCLGLLGALALLGVAAAGAGTTAVAIVHFTGL